MSFGTSGVAPSTLSLGSGGSSSPSSSGFDLSSLLGPLLGGAGAGLLSSVPKNVNTNSSGTGNSSTSSAGTSTTQQNLTPYQEALQGPLFSMIQQVMKNPASFTAPAENNAVNSVNDNFSGLAKSLRSQFLQTGGGQSGKYGTALASGDISRLSNISGVQNQFANTNAMLPLNVASSLAMPLLGMNFGSTTSGSSSGGTNTDQSQQTQQTTSNGGTGGAISSGIGSILSSLAPLLMFA